MLSFPKTSKKIGGRAENVASHLQAPVGGLNAVSSIMAMPRTDATVLENWIAYPDRLQLRPGVTEHATGSVSTVQALYSYGSPSGTNTLFATNTTGVYDVTSAGAWPAAAIALTNGATVGSIISTGASNYLTIVNGVDSAVQFDGAVWSSIAAFGVVNTNTLSYVETYRQRLFFIVENSLNLFYLAANAVSGAGTTYTFASVFRRGGYLVAIGTWTIDGGTGPDDHLVLVTSQGELAVFVGADPATWTFRGVYYIGRPLGKKPLYKYGGDILFLSENGLFPLSKALLVATIDRSQAISQKINQIFSDAASQFFANSGWEMVALPDIPLLLVNVPGSVNRYQYAMHLQTGAWTVFSGWAPFCFARNGATAYFGTATGVSTIGGVSDYGANIVATMLQAYTSFGLERNKKIEEIRPVLEINADITYTLGVASDFSALKASNVLTSGVGSAALWGVGVWGTALWSASSTVDRSWRSVPDEYSVWKALYLQVSTATASVEYLGNDLLLRRAGSF